MNRKKTSEKPETRQEIDVDDCVLSVSGWGKYIQAFVQASNDETQNVDKFCQMASYLFGTGTTDLIDKNGHILPTGQWYAPSAVIKHE